jgi:hypothetical protein
MKFKEGDLVQLKDFEPDGYHEMYKSSIVKITGVGTIINGKQIYHYEADCKMFCGKIHSGTTEDNLIKL